MMDAQFKESKEAEQKALLHLYYRGKISLSPVELIEYSGFECEAEMYLGEHWKEADLEDLEAFAIDWDLV